jgi:PHD/YefM family antitoxin component YafN of YafNO toxin-antitoxin module
VIGGPGAFIIPADDFESFQNAVLRKLIREISTAPDPRILG